MKKLYNLSLTFALLAITNSCYKRDLLNKNQKYTIEQFMNTTQIFGSDFSANEKSVLITSKASGVLNAYSINIETGEQTQLTNSSENAIIAQSYFPSDDRIIYTSDQGGNELDHLYIKNMEGNVIDLTPDSAKASYYGWNHGKTAIYWASNKRDPRYFDMYRTAVIGASIKEGEFQTERLYTNNNGYTPSIISDNERYIALSERLTTSDVNIHLLDTQTGDIQLITPHDEEAINEPQFFSKDNNTLYFTTDIDSEFTYLMSYEINTQKQKVEQKAKWDINYAFMSYKGTYIVTGINNDASTKIIIQNTQSKEIITIPDLPEGDISSLNISDSETQMTFYLSNSKIPRDLFLYHLKTKTLKKLTNTLNPEINPDDLVAGQVIRFPSFDSLSIPAILYKPNNIQIGDKLPALLYIHGGPGGQTRLNYTDKIQYWVNQGYVVLAVNNRGSSGYGKTFYKADNLKHGDVDLKDCIASKKFLINTGYVDRNKIGIMGGSYGGYLVMAALAFAPNEFAVGINYFGVTNWLRTLRSIPTWWEASRNALYSELGNPETDSLALYNKSPLFFAHQITKPFIVFQGANDPRVLQIESDEIVAEARKNNIPVNYIVFPDEGHGFSKKTNNIEASYKALEFLDKYLKGI
jgi:dipeptidyl aminopeptidase/acylaminoacyl peptidase